MSLVNRKKAVRFFFIHLLQNITQEQSLTPLLGQNKSGRQPQPVYIFDTRFYQSLYG